MNQRIKVRIGDDFPARDLPLADALAVATQLHNEGQLDRAALAYRSILDTLPDQADALHYLGVLQLQRAQLDPALDLLERAVKARDDCAQAWLHLGQARRQAQHQDDARLAFQRALQLDPRLAAAYNALGAIDQAQGNAVSAARHFRSALKIEPDHRGAVANLAACLLQLGDLRGAIEQARAAVSANPELGAVHKCLGTALFAIGQVDEAIAVLKQAVSLSPEDADACYQLGCALDGGGQWDAALDCLQQSLVLRPDFPAANAAALFLSRRLCRWDESDPLSQQLIRDIEAGAPGVTPFVSLSERTTPAQQLACADRWAVDIAARVEQLPAVLPSDQGPVTVGYLSNGFGQHPTACLTAEFFECHDGDHFRTIGYSVGPDDASSLRRRIQAAMTGFRDLYGHAHRDIAQAIRNDAVDILVDLRGFGGGAVSEVMAMRPAAVQVNWLAYPGTMGSAFMDYIVVDDHVAPPDVRAHFGETAVILPGAYQPTDTTRDPSVIALSRHDCGLPVDGMVYCSFNNSYKYSRPIVDCWMGILKAVPGSVLWLLSGQAGTSTEQHLREHARVRGVDPGRLLFMPKQPHLDYLARYRLVDLFLDTVPYNAHTTASDALWGGCPVLTCSGQTFAARVAGSLAIQVGLDELVVDSLDEYQRLAVAIGLSADRCAALKQELLANRASSPLFQTARLCRHMESAYRTMLEQRRDGHSETIRIKGD